MPYIAKKDRDYLDPLIAKLKERILSLCSGGDGDDLGLYEKAGGYMFYVALNVFEKTSLNAAEQYQGRRGVRYWLVADHIGVAMNIANELFDRVWLRLNKTYETFGEFIMFYGSTFAMPEIPDDAASLDSEIVALANGISLLAGPQGSGYAGAYCGLVNYSMTELMPRVIMGLVEQTGGELDLLAIGDLICFWAVFGSEIYKRIARPYEEEQIKKSGDVAVYQELL